MDHPNLGVEFSGSPDFETAQGSPVPRLCVDKQQQATQYLIESLDNLDIKNHSLTLCDVESLLWKAQDAIQQGRMSHRQHAAHISNPAHDETDTNSPESDTPVLTQL